MAQSAQVKKVSNWMQALSDFMVAHPQARAYEAAEFFGVTEAWLSTVKNSDAFQYFHSERRNIHFDRISNTVGEKLQTLAEISLDEMTERLEEQRDELPISVLQDVGKMAIGALGFGSKTNGNGMAVQVNVNGNGVNANNILINNQSALERSREKLAQIRQTNDVYAKEQSLALEQLSEGNLNGNSEQKTLNDLGLEDTGAGHQSPVPALPETTTQGNFIASSTNGSSDLSSSSPLSLTSPSDENESKE